MVNGAVVIENATHTGALPGKVLRRDAERSRRLRHCHSGMWPIRPLKDAATGNNS